MAKVLSVQDNDWRVESDLNTLMEAEKIRNDPKRFAKAKALAKSKILQAAAVAGSDSDKE